MSEPHTTVLRFEPGTSRPGQLEEEISAMLLELADSSSELAERAKEDGFTPQSFTGAHVEVTQEGKGFGEVVILVAIGSSVAGHMIEKAWDDLIWPRIKGRLGADALGKKIEHKPND
jgi:hypothetical protein